MISLTAQHQNTLDSQYQDRKTCMHAQRDGHIVLAVPEKTPGERQHLDPSFKRIPAQKQANSECNAKLGKLTNQVRLWPFNFTSWRMGNDPAQHLKSGES